MVVYLRDPKQKVRQCDFCTGRPLPKMGKGFSDPAMHYLNCIFVKSVGKQNMSKSPVLNNRLIYSCMNRLYVIPPAFWVYTSI